MTSACRRRTLLIALALCLGSGSSRSLTVASASAPDHVRAAALDDRPDHVRGAALDDPPDHVRGADGPAVAGSPSTGFRLPLAGPAEVLTPFRPPTNRYGSGHRGVDLAAPVGTGIYAASSGIVVYAGPLAGRGVISIEHLSGLRTTYEPVAASVAPGQRVFAGQAVGVLQAGHASCAPASCLHWGARLPDGSYLDPMSLLTGLRVRLLPWAGS